ncbi:MULTISPECIES: GNAT family N-acetyltransferase [unclassified Paenibacillus]|uniref:GNAT family N-acetyltransferase n=1 Tax=unclassified Paenibacillus TaxID=185978 RepID=UPI002472EDB9|nr:MULTISPECIES: GNAT family N-acetyltransferase [unclassified Paenibacillus]MDH6427070.1 ribosomal protein S18 acetylase RimI-like enzyme [Paenibacillus sp. PastH-4]MDH6443099.1 ribosomal protein S18 acetylase RimI-like enzyme [Paenibacillus sp. PastF-4]MDH6526194.1 ribosomal protein S18 acetylase RimI-like enzyme [Paenibacillus sp. PastH-3]
MQLMAWSDYEISYDLNNDFSIRKAESEEWGLNCSIYYNMQYNGFFKEERFNSAQRNAFWIYRGESKIGGVRMSPNRIYHLFVIPPFNDTFVVLKLLKKLLIYWSDRTKPIKTFEVLPDQVQLFARAGFWPDEFRCRWMHRPTDHFEVEWNEELRIESPQIEDNGMGAKRFILEEQIAECNYASFDGSLEATRRKKFSYEDFIPSEEPNYTNEVLLTASTLVYDKKSGQLIANCLLGLQDDYAAVYSIGVIPAYRGKGIATRMLKRGLNFLKDKYPILRLYVMEGNDAESVYLNLGFVPGVQEIQSMYIPMHD